MSGELPQSEQKLYKFFLLDSFHINFLNTVNLGRPETLRINFVLKLNNIKINNGKDEIKCMTK